MTERKQGHSPLRGKPLDDDGNIELSVAAPEREPAPRPQVPQYECLECGAHLDGDSERRQHKHSRFKELPSRPEVESAAASSPAVRPQPHKFEPKFPASPFCKYCGETNTGGNHAEPAARAEQPTRVTEEEINAVVRTIFSPEQAEELRDAISFLRTFVGYKKLDILKACVHEWLIKHHYAGNLTRDGETSAVPQPVHPDALEPGVALTIANSAGLRVDYFGGLEDFREFAGRIVKAWGRYTQPPAKNTDSPFAKRGKVGSDEPQ